MRGSAIYRIGYQRWVAPIWVALGKRADYAGCRPCARGTARGLISMVREHVSGPCSSIGPQPEAVGRVRVGGAFQER